MPTLIIGLLRMSLIGQYLFVLVLVSISIIYLLNHVSILMSIHHFCCIFPRTLVYMLQLGSSIFLPKWTFLLVKIEDSGVFKSLHEGYEFIFLISQVHCFVVFFPWLEIECIEQQKFHVSIHPSLVVKINFLLLLFLLASKSSMGFLSLIPVRVFLSGLSEISLWLKSELSDNFFTTLI